MKKHLIIFSFLMVNTALGSTFNCQREFIWLKQTFEENDAGFSFLVDKKGQSAYQKHTLETEKAINLVTSDIECVSALQEWLSFFRKGHIGLRLNKDTSENNFPVLNEPKKLPISEVHYLDIDKFKVYLSNKSSEDLEGIWQFYGYTAALKKHDEDYWGYVVSSKNPDWVPGEVKFKLYPKKKGGYRVMPIS
ncbi:hypothetical protein [Neptunicella sp.]|uniref:hypothetical protein n=1 Tax=Neptunicella sp. TaxID=2125986 RepID=UPI003F6933CA